MISQTSFTAMFIMIAIGIILPIGLAAWWMITKKERIEILLAGAATWYVFAVVLENIPKSILFDPSRPVGRTLTEHVLLATLVAALLAGFFEETGRFFVFKYVIKKRDNKETAISHGIGHGGFEALYLLVVTGIQNIIYATMINNSAFDALLDTASTQGIDISALEVLPEALKSLTPLTALISGFERVCAILLHIGLSILVFYAVKRSKTGLYFLAVLLHALFDLPAALYQFGIIQSVYVVEALLAVYAVVFFVTVLRKLYNNYDSDYEEICN